MKIIVRTGYRRGVAWQRTWQICSNDLKDEISGISTSQQQLVYRLTVTQKRRKGSYHLIIPKPPMVEIQERMFLQLRKWLSTHVLDVEMEPSHLSLWPKTPQILFNYLSEQMPEVQNNERLIDLALTVGRILREELPLPKNVLTDQQIEDRFNLERRGFVRIKNPNHEAILALMLEPLLEASKDALLDRELILPGRRPLVEILGEATESISQLAGLKPLIIEVNLTQTNDNPEKVDAEVVSWRKFPPKTRWREIEWRITLKGLRRPFNGPSTNGDSRSMIFLG